MRTKWDEGKVPDDFPKLKARGWIGSQGGKPYMAFYSAKDVWKWFKTQNSLSTTNKGGEYVRPASGA